MGVKKEMLLCIFIFCFAMVLITANEIWSGDIKGPDLKAVPPEYQNKHMPEGWWTNPKIIEEGKQIWLGRHEAILDPDVICAACHGKDGKPILTGARDFRDKGYVDQMTDSYWFFRMSEGVPDKAMPPWKGILTEEERWKVIAYEHTFSHGGKPAEHKHGK